LLAIEGSPSTTDSLTGFSPGKRLAASETFATPMALCGTEMRASAFGFASKNPVVPFSLAPTASEASGFEFLPAASR
jgi:hypothetical protein